MLPAQDIPVLLLNERHGWLAFLSTLTRDESLAEELFQELVAGAFWREEGFDSMDEWRAHFRRMATQSALRAVSKIAPADFFLSEETLAALEGEWNAHGGETTAEELEALSQSIFELPAQDLVLIRRRYLDARPLAELAAKGSQAGPQAGPGEGVQRTLARVHAFLERTVRLKLSL